MVKGIRNISPMICIKRKQYWKNKILSFILGIVIAGLVLFWLTPEKIVTERIEVDPYTKQEHKIISHISDKYKISLITAASIVKQAKIHIKVIPLSDILALLAIESSFKIDAIAPSTGAKGLAQILYKPTSYDIAINITDGMQLIKQYKEKLVKEEAYIQAYNLGISNYLRGVRNNNYYNKFSQTRQEFKQVLG